MSVLSFIEKQTICRLFGISDGFIFKYWSDKGAHNKSTTKELIYDSCGINIFEDAGYKGLSQQKCIQKIWDECSPQIIAKLLKALSDYFCFKMGTNWWSDEDNYVFVNELGNLMNPNYLTSQFPQYIQKHGCKRMRFHDLRHSCASLLLANGVPLKQIQEWLGHSDFSTTANIYAHLDFSSKLSSASAMVNGMALPETVNFSSKWSENLYEDGKNRA